MSELYIFIMMTHINIQNKNNINKIKIKTIIIVSTFERFGP